MAAITSQLTEHQHSLAIEPHDCVEGTLPRQSLVKLMKIFTNHSTLIVKKLLRGS